MSRRVGAPYDDRVEDSGKMLIYEGYDVPKSAEVPFPKQVDQQMVSRSGMLTQNGLFYESVKNHKERKSPPEQVRVYEKIKQSIWVYNGTFMLIDAWHEESNDRKVFKFKLQMQEDSLHEQAESTPVLPHNRLIPSSVKLEVWKRDKGACVLCGSTENLHFDHIIPFSKGGSSLVAENIQILCAKHNLGKKDQIL